MTTLSREDGPALWRQIEARLRGEIGGTFPPGARLPSEADLSRRFGVNRHTLRRAMEELSRGGLVRVEHGRGAFVPEDVLDYVVEPRTRFSEWVRRHNKEPSGRVLRLIEEPADALAATALGVEEGTSVVLLERLGLADGRPVSLGTHRFAPRLRGLMDALADGGTITAALRAVGVEDYVRQVTRVTARMPSAAEAELLRTARSRPLLITENVNVDRAGAVVEFGISRYPTPRVQIVFEP
ncbi:MAG: phosphonate metabolism transcriptional regulator PhnF [Acetobacteraceae bacterium]